MAQTAGQVASATLGTAVVGDRARRSWLVAWFAIALAAAALVLAVLAAISSGDPSSIFSHQLLLPFSAAGFAVIGGLVATGRQANPIGWICLATAVMQAGVAIAGYVSTGQLGGGAVIDLGTWLGLWLWVPAIFIPTFLVFMVFPNGRLLSRRWRPAFWAGLAGIAATSAGLALLPGPLVTWSTPANPYGVGALARVLGPALDLGTALLGVGVISSVIALAARFRGARGVERSQLKWLVYAAGMLLATFLVGGLATAAFPGSRLASEMSIIGTNLAVLGIAAAAGAAVLYHRLYDIELIINRTLVFGALTAAVAALYVVAIGATGMLLRESNVVGSVLATGVVAVLFQPLRARLQRGVNRLLYGQRDEPIAVLAALGEQLERASGLDQVPLTLVRTVAESLKLPYVALALNEPDGLRVAAEYGRPVTSTVKLPLVYQQQEIGELRVAPRDQREALDPADRALLETVVRQAGAALRGVQLTRDLRRSHLELVTSREEERRRLRRDLHDGLGPALASLTLGLDAARNLLDSEPKSVSPLLLELRQQVQAVIKDVRRLVYDLRPPALDELGLVGALREQVGQYEQQGLSVEVRAVESLPPLPAAVEVAAFRIVQEALTNVTRHAKARACRVTLEAAADLNVIIEDDGVGLPATVRPGVGLNSMRERAIELGGRFCIRALDRGGTVVSVTLPLSGGP